MIITINLFVSPTGQSNNFKSVQSEFSNRNLSVHQHAHGLTVQGEWNEVMDGVKSVIEQAHTNGAGRVFSNIQIDSQSGDVLSIEEKISRVSSN